MMAKGAFTCVLGAVCFAVLAIGSPLSESTGANPFDSLHETNTSSDAIVFVYISGPGYSKITSRKNYLLEFLKRITEKVQQSAENEESEGGKEPFDTENIFKNRIDKNRSRPSLDINEEETKKPATFIDFPSHSEVDRVKESDSKDKIPPEGESLTFHDRHNPNNILQKGSSIPNSPSSEIFAASTASGISQNQPSRRDAIDTKDFTFDILKNSRWDNQNVVMSPFGVYNFISILLLGADGRTFQELAQRVKKSDPIVPADVEKSARFHSAFQRLLRYLNNNSGSDAKLEIANIIYTDSEFPIKPSFLHDAKEYYDAPAQEVDFATEGEQFKNKVNQWISRKTHGKIENIVQDSPSPMTTLAFVNAVYFKGEWENPFPKQFTRKKDFFTSSKETVPTKLMTNQLIIPYMENDEFQMISLPYRDKKTAFFVILPTSFDGVEGLKKVESRLNSRILTESIQAMKYQTVAVKLPKMNIRTDGQMQDVLIKMGLNSIFDSQLANFSRLSDKRGLYVSSVYHQACIDLDESGTEASAATIGIGDRTIDEIPITFIANRPFIFFIHHIRAETTLFWGRFIRPQFSE